MRVQQIMSHDPESIEPDTTLIETAQLMKTLNVGILPVCKDAWLLGVVTDRDIILRAVAEGRDPKATRVEDIMTRDVVCCHEQQNLKVVVRMMEERQLRRLPVLDEDDWLVGIVTVGDLAVRTHKRRLAGEALEKISEPAPTFNHLPV